MTQAHQDDDCRMRIALSVPSAASLGAYDAGAVAALLVAVQRLQRDDAVAQRPLSVVIDAIGATSAGALVGLLAARCLLGGLDPVATMRTAWVTEASLSKLRKRARRAPLSIDHVDRAARSLLAGGDSRDRVAAACRQSAPLVFSVAVGCLQGLAFGIDGGDADPAVAAMTHVDWTEFVLSRDDDVDRYVRPERRSPLDVVLASMSHPGAFPPRLLDRRDELARYRARGVTNIPASGHLWCADGSAMLQRPLGATLNAARRAERLDQRDEDAAEMAVAPRRIHVLVQPHTAPPADSGRWTNPARQPPWPSTLARTIASLTPEPLYRDECAMERTNVRLAWAEELVQTLAPQLSADVNPALKRLLEEMDGTATAAPTNGADSADTHPSVLLRRLVMEVSDLSGKTPITTEVISPLRLVDDNDARPREQTSAVAAGQQQVKGILAGEFLGRFGGLVDRDVRDSDFVSGWLSCRAWLPEALQRHGFRDDRVAAATDAVDERQITYPDGGRRGEARLSDLPLRNRLRVAATLLSGARIAVGAALSKRGW